MRLNSWQVVWKSLRRNVVSALSRLGTSDRAPLARKLGAICGTLPAAARALLESSCDYWRFGSFWQSAGSFREPMWSPRTVKANEGTSSSSPSTTQLLFDLTASAKLI